MSGHFLHAFRVFALHTCLFMLYPYRVLQEFFYQLCIMNYLTFLATKSLIFSSVLKIFFILEIREFMALYFTPKSIAISVFVNPMSERQQQWMSVGIRSGYCSESCANRLSKHLSATFLSSTNSILDNCLSTYWNLLLYSHHVSL